ncbi:MAG: IS66 family insertion sequence element accessory protein TnpA [Bdellovibrio sp.]
MRRERFVLYEAFWRQHIELANRYPDGIQKYCRANGLASQTLDKWRRNLSLKTKKSTANLVPTNPFAEVRVCRPKVESKVECKVNLPEAKWLAEFIHQLIEVRR